MKHSNGFYYHNSLLTDHNGEYSLKHTAWLLLQRAHKKNPAILEMVKINDHVWDRANKDLVEKTDKQVIARALIVTPRLQRAKNHIEELNRKYLATLTTQQAREAFDAKKEESSCFYWFEILPPGISLQLASNATNLKFCLSWWEGQVQKWEEYTPNAKKPTKGRGVAKRI